MSAWDITVTIHVDAEERDDAMATVQELMNDAVFDRTDDRFGSVVDVYSGVNWSIAPGTQGGSL